jgi:arylsulfatase A-like enzyme
MEISMKKPNILFLMVDQMQAQVLNANHQCITPNFDKLAERGVKFHRAYTPNAVCSPARASLMTGLLPHNHGVVYVTHICDDDQAVLRKDKPHWAQKLSEAGYYTAYFGKWHVERANELERYGWQLNACRSSKRYQERAKEKNLITHKFDDLVETKNVLLPEGYKEMPLYGVTDHPIESRDVGLTTDLAMEFLDNEARSKEPWCCMVSIKEPHDPFITGREAYDMYDVDSIKLPGNYNDPMKDKPGIYNKLATVWSDMTKRQKKEAAACYYASITEVDQQYGRLIDKVDEMGQTENTIIIFTTDHGELLGAHRLYFKNYSAFEEIYNIPMIIAGPGIAQGKTSDARIGLHDLCPTICDLAGAEWEDVPDSKSFSDVLMKPEDNSSKYKTGFAEYYGGPFLVSQDVYWEDDWKFVFNGFDYDELYNLKEDPDELYNKINDPEYKNIAKGMMKKLWEIRKKTGGVIAAHCHYPALRVGIVGPQY